VEGGGKGVKKRAEKAIEKRAEKLVKRRVKIYHHRGVNGDINPSQTPYFSYICEPY
jgi:hypothetical protein